MTVYLVTAGDCDDYHIEAIFSTHEKAVEYMGEFAKEFNGVDEYELDAKPTCNLVKSYVHWLTGTGEDVQDPYSRVTEPKPTILANGRGTSSTRTPTYTEQWSTAAVFFGESYISAEHAKQLAVEERERHLRKHA